MDNAFISQYLHWDDRSSKNWHRPINKVLAKLRINALLIQRAYPFRNGNSEARMNVFHLASQCAAMNIPGDMIELGCNSGESSIIIQKVINHYSPDKKLHCFDSFEGLPELHGEDKTEGVYAEGFMEAALQEFYDNFKAVGIDPPENVNKGWFNETVPQNLPDQISFALVDGDIYDSTKYVLPYVYERLAPGAVCMLGVYYDDKIFSRPHTWPQHKSPGVKRATDEFFADKPESVSVLYANEYSNGYFRKQ